MSIENSKILKFTEDFNNQFREYLISPTLDSFPEEEHSRIAIENNHIILPAQKKFSDWDIYCYVNKEKINPETLYKMRDFIISYNDFDLIIDYATNNKKYIEAKAYQSLRENKMYFMQFMGIVKETDFAPFIDLHIGNIESGLLEEFYKNICKEEDEDYFNWSLLSIFRKLKNTGEVKRDGTMYTRSILPMLSDTDKEKIENDFIDFILKHFENKKKFQGIINFLMKQ